MIGAPQRNRVAAPATRRRARPTSPRPAPRGVAAAGLRYDDAMVSRAAIVLWAVTGCGRIGFDAPEGAGTGTTPPGCSQQAERCNGVDDNCDGAIDEGCTCTPFDVTLPNSRYGAALAWLGNGYAVLLLNGSAATLTVLDEAGKVVGTSPLPATDATLIQAPGTITWTGAEIAVVWATSAQVQLARYSPAAAPIGTPIVISADGKQPGTPQVAWAGDRLAILWDEDQQLQLREIGADGAPLRQLAIGGLSATESLGSFAVTPDSYAIVLSDNNLTGVENPDELVMVDRAAWTASAQRSLTAGSEVAFPPVIVAAPDGTLAVVDPKANTASLQIRNRDGSPRVAPTPVPPYANEVVDNVSLAPFDGGFHIAASGFSDAWEEDFDPASGSYSPAVVKASYTGNSTAATSVVTASGRQGLALTYAPSSTTPSSTRLIQTCP